MAAIHRLIFRSTTIKSRKTKCFTQFGVVLLKDQVDEGTNLHLPNYLLNFITMVLSNLIYHNLAWLEL